MVEAYVYALITMVFFSLANIAMKLIIKPELIDAVSKNSGFILPSIGIFILAALAVYFLFLSKIPLPENTIPLVLGFIVLAMTGFVFLMIAVSMGKIAPITAIVSTSSVLVAILSVVFLKDTLKLTEIAGIGLAFLGVLLLALGK